MHPWVKGIHVVQVKEPTTLLQRIYKNFIKKKHGTMHPGLNGNKVCSIEESSPFTRGDNYEIAESITKFKKSSPEPLGQFQ